MRVVHLLIVFFTAGFLVYSLITGTTYAGARPGDSFKIRRDERPVAYWLVIGVLVAIIVHELREVLI